MTWGTLVVRAAAGPGVGAGHVMRCLALVERWASQDDLTAHFGMPYMAAIGPIAEELLSEPPRIVFSTPTPVGSPPKSTLSGT